MTILDLDGNLNVNTFKVLADKLKEQDTTILNQGELCINLREVQFADPFGIMGLIILIRSVFSSTGLKTTIILPSKMDVRSYIISSGFHIKLERICNFERMPRLFTRLWGTTNHNFIPLSDITSEQDIKTINDKVSVWLVDNKFEQSEIMDIEVLISELCQNVIYHSETPHTGLFFMQAYKRRNGEKYCSLIIGDSGIGIKNHLLRNSANRGKIISDVNAIRFVMSDGLSGVTETEARFRGNGFFNLDRISRKHHANLYIHSHSGLCVFKYIKGMDKRNRHDYTIYLIVGTQVCLEINGKSP